VKKKLTNKHKKTRAAKKRKNGVGRRKNFFPTLVITFTTWVALASIIYFINPTSPGVIPLFFLLLFIASLFTFSSLFANSKRGLIIAIMLVVFLILRYLGVGNIINLLLLIGLGITIDLYLSKNS